MVFTLVFVNFSTCDGHVIQSKSVEKTKEFSPYYAAFSEDLKRDIKEYERLKEQLKHFHAIDWDEVAKVKAFESSSSD